MYGHDASCPQVSHLGKTLHYKLGKIDNNQ